MPINFKVHEPNQMDKVFSNFVNGMMVLKPPQRAEVMRWVEECYCIKCGYPAPPKGEDCVTCSLPNGDPR
jgi:hypothetical protein